jgi:hypothetical protein
MNSNAIINDDMTLEEKLAAIDAAMNDPDKKKDFNIRNGRPADAPVDPMDMLHCEGCQ